MRRGIDVVQHEVCVPKHPRDVLSDSNKDSAQANPLVGRRRRQTTPPIIPAVWTGAQSRVPTNPGKLLDFLY